MNPVASLLPARVAALPGCVRGSVATIGALALPVVLGLSALALEYGSALQARVEMQRVADLASHAGAVAYGRSGSVAEMDREAASVARLNGIDPAALDVALEPRPGGAQAVRATIVAERPLLLARVIGVTRPLEVSVTALAGTEASEPACLLALDPSGRGVRLSGGTSATARECAVASNATVSAPCGTSITTPVVTYNSGTPTQCGNIRRQDGGAADVRRAETVDPLAGHAAIAAATARVAQVAAMAPPSLTAIPTGVSIEFGWSDSTTRTQAQQAGCSASRSGSVWTLTCSGRPSYNFGSITIGGGLSLSFNPGGSPSTVYNFSGTIRNDSGSTMTFPAGVYNVAGGIVSQGGATTRFGAGTYRVGRAALDCGSSGARYSICNQSTLTFGGPSSFELPGGIHNGGGATLAMGQGKTNVFRVGASSGGDALFLGGGSNTVLADATGTGRTFELAGNVRGGGGGSCLSLGAAEQHDIRGHLVAAGGILFGSGTYTVDGFLHFGRDGGGTSWCNGAEVGVWADAATFVVSGRSAPASAGVCGNQAFCVGAGYRSVRLRAPEAGPLARLALIGPSAPSVRSGASLQQGATDTRISGVVYFPNGPFVMSGGASAADAQGGCFQLIAREVELSGGATAASDCISGGGGAGARVRLLQ